MRDLVKETPLTVAYLSKNTNETLQLCSKGEFLKLYYGKAEKQFRCSISRQATSFGQYFSSDVRLIFLSVYICLRGKSGFYRLFCVP